MAAAAAKEVTREDPIVRLVGNCLDDQRQQQIVAVAVRPATAGVEVVRCGAEDLDQLGAATIEILDPGLVRSEGERLANAGGVVEEVADGDRRRQMRERRKMSPDGIVERESVPLGESKDERGEELFTDRAELENSAGVDPDGARRVGNAVPACEDDARAGVNVADDGYREPWDAMLRER